ncbi:uncharacterized protein LOC121726083 [Aricia agestis]|uniref:uncharacterized protein LOC121726083 n=1 Tax=Aricia agestis TaxID=91739 RepID=UPI001C201DCA|nr:uncharacterized protein LOC121726083 [Aricia agestis]
MKVAFALLALVSLSCAAPQARKSFHEHYEDFIGLIMEEARDDIKHITGHYLEFEEFLAGLDYLGSKDFKELVYEMEDLPEFKAVVEFLEGHGIDIMYFVDFLNQTIESMGSKRTERHTLSGRDISAYIKDVISEFPKAKLTALYEQKVAEDEDFANAMADLETDEWKQIFQALLNSETFQKEAQTLHEHGIDLDVVIGEITAVFGIY